MSDDRPARAEPWICPSCKKPRMTPACKVCRVKREDAAAWARDRARRAPAPLAGK